PALRGPVRAAHVLREDPPRLDPPNDVDAHVAMERRADVVGAHRRRDPHGGGLVAAPGVERAGDLALPVEDMAALLHPAGDEEVAVDGQQVLAVEPRLPDLTQRADRLGFPRDRHDAGTVTTGSALPAATGGAGVHAGRVAHAGERERRHREDPEEQAVGGETLRAARSAEPER